jgi:hypothetical protein
MNLVQKHTISRLRRIWPKVKLSISKTNSHKNLFLKLYFKVLNKLNAQNNNKIHFDDKNLSIYSTQALEMILRYIIFEHSMLRL